MKCKLIILACSVLVIASCRKSGNPDTLYGTWELRATLGGNIVPSTLPPGNGHTVSFTADTYSYFDGNQPGASGSYQLKQVNGFNYIVTQFGDQCYVLSADTLVLYPYVSNPDVATAKYVKISNEPQTAH